MRNCERHHFSLASASMEYIIKNNLPLVNQWTQDIWTKFCAWLMDESEPGAIVLEEGGKPTKDDPVKPMEPPFNAAAMRKAMVRIKNVADDYEQCATKAGPLNAIYDLACAALATPPRNCDVGTADEQAERFDAECKRHEHCTPCPVHAAWGEFKKGKPKSCQAIWGQMPYVQKEEVKEC